MSLIHDSEREDFALCIVAANLNVVDFELTEQEDEPGTMQVAVWTGVKPKIFGPLTLLGFSVVDSFFLQSSTVRIAPGSCQPMIHVA